MSKKLLVILAVAIIIGVIFHVILLEESDKTTSAEWNSDFPRKNQKCLFYLNLSNIEKVDLQARGSVKRATQLCNAEFVLILLDDIPDTYTMESYAAGLFDAWRIGGDKQGRGVLILIVEKKQAVKIEVGYALEDVFTDAYCGSFQETIKFHFAGRFFGDVVSNLVNSMVYKYQDGDDHNEFYSAVQKDDSCLSGGAGVLEEGFIYNKKERIAKILKDQAEAAQKYKSTKDAETTFLQYQQSLEDGINYPYLDLFTQGSQYMRVEYLHPPSFYVKDARKNGKAYPYRIVYDGDLATVRFKSPKQLPVFMRRDPEGFWRLDITKSWACSQATFDLTKIFPLYRDHPWMYAFPEYKYRQSRLTFPELVPFSLDLDAKISQLQQAIKADPQNAVNYFELADIYFWECYWIGAAIDTVEQGLILDPENVPYRWLAIQMRFRYPKPDGIQDHFEVLLKRTPYDGEVLSQYLGFARHYMFDDEKVAELNKKIKIYKKTIIRDIAPTLEGNEFYIFTRKLKCKPRAALVRQLQKTGDIDKIELLVLGHCEHHDLDGYIIGYYKKNMEEYPRFKQHYHDRMMARFPGGLREVTINEFTEPPVDGLYFSETNQKFLDLGMDTSTVIVALDGYEIHNQNQYLWVLGLKNDPSVDFIVWHDEQYKEVSVTDLPNRKFGLDISSYRKLKWRE